MGEAGVGKTSLVCAGLSPRLEHMGTLPVYVDGIGSVTDTLRKALFQASASPPQADEETVAYAVRLAALLAGAALLVPPTEAGHQRLAELLDHIFLF